MSAITNEKIRLLSNITLFKGLSAEQLATIASVAFFKTYAEGEVVIEQDKPSRFLYVICSGKVKIVKTSKEGRAKILGFLDPGDFFGEISLLTEFNPSATVECKEEAKLLIIDREDFLVIIKDHFEITMRILEEISRRLYYADIEIVDLSFESIMHRFIKTILLLAKKPASKDKNQMEINIPMTHKEIAEIIGTRRELVTKIISQLKKDDMIDVLKDRRIIIKDVKKIRQLLK